MNIFKNYINYNQEVILSGQIDFPEKLTTGQAAQMGPVSLLDNNYTYFTLTTNKSDGNKYYICRLDNANNFKYLYISQPSNTDDYRGHLRPTFIDDGNRFIVACEVAHNSSVKIFEVDKELTSALLIHTIGADMAYTSILKAQNEYVIYGRSLDEHNLKVFKTNGGDLSNWAGIKISKGALPDWIYPHLPRINEYNGEWYFEAYKRKNPEINYYDKYLLITSDFITWRNIDSTFSKDVTGSPITMLEFDNYRTFGNGDNTVDYRISRSLVNGGSVYGAIYNNNETSIYKVSPDETTVYPVDITDLRLPDNYLNNGYPIISDMFIVGDTCYYIANVGQDGNYRQEFWKSNLEFQRFSKIGDLDGVVNQAPYNVKGGEFYILGDLTETYPDYDPIIYNKVRIKQ